MKLLQKQGGSIAQDYAVPIVHTGRRSGEQQNAFHESPNGDGESGKATGDNTTDQRNQQLYHASCGESQIEVVDSQGPEDDSQ